MGDSFIYIHMKYTRMQYAIQCVQQTVFHLNNVYCLAFSSTFRVVAWHALSCIVVAENKCVCARI